MSLNQNNPKQSNAQIDTAQPTTQSYEALHTEQTPGVDIGYVTFFPTTSVENPAFAQSESQNATNIANQKQPSELEKQNEPTLNSKSDPLPVKPPTDEFFGQKKQIKLTSHHPPVAGKKKQASDSGQKGTSFISSKPTQGSSGVKTQLRIGIQSSMPISPNHQSTKLQIDSSAQEPQLVTLGAPAAAPTHFIFNSNEKQQKPVSVVKQVQNGGVKSPPSSTHATPQFNMVKASHVTQSQVHRGDYDTAYEEDRSNSELAISQLSPASTKLNSPSEFNSSNQTSVQLQKQLIEAAEKDIEQATLKIVNATEQVTFKFRTVTPQSTTDDSGKQPEHSPDDPPHSVNEKLQQKQVQPKIVDSSQKPSTGANGDSKNMRVTKRLRQTTGESKQMRSSHYEHMKEAAKNGQKQSFVPEQAQEEQQSGAPKAKVQRERPPPVMAVPNDNDADMLGGDLPSATQKQKRKNSLSSPTSPKSSKVATSESNSHQKRQGVFSPGHSVEQQIINAKSMQHGFVDPREPRSTSYNEGGTPLVTQIKNSSLPIGGNLEIIQEFSTQPSMNKQQSTIHKASKNNSQLDKASVGASSVKKQTRYPRAANNPKIKSSAKPSSQIDTNSQMDVSDVKSTNTQEKRQGNYSVALSDQAQGGSPTQKNRQPHKLADGQFNLNITSLDDQISMLMSHQSRDVVMKQKQHHGKVNKNEDAYQTPSQQQRFVQGSQTVIKQPETPNGYQNVDVSDLMRNLRQIDTSVTHDRSPSEVNYGPNSNYFVSLSPTDSHKNKKLQNQIKIQNPGFATPTSHISRGGTQLSKPSIYPHHALVITPPTIITGAKRMGGHGRVYSPTSNHQIPNNQYVDWLNSKNGHDDEFTEVSAHQASMIQKYSALGSSALSTDGQNTNGQQQRFYVSPRAAPGYATPMSPLNHQTASLFDSQQINSPRVRNNNSTLSGFFNGGVGSGQSQSGSNSVMHNHQNLPGHQNLHHHNYLFSQQEVSTAGAQEPPVVSHRRESLQTSQQAQPPAPVKHVQPQVPKRQGQALLPDCFLGKISNSNSQSRSHPDAKHKASAPVTGQEVRKSRNLNSQQKAVTTEHSQAVDQVFSTSFLNNQIGSLAKEQYKLASPQH